MKKMMSESQKSEEIKKEKIMNYLRDIILSKFATFSGTDKKKIWKYS